MRNIQDDALNKLRLLELNDMWRPYFGLNSIDGLDFVAINEKTTLFYAGNTIKKVVNKEVVAYKDYFKWFELVEYDTELVTNARKTILPLTKRGKEKKITTTNVLSFLPKHCRFSIYIGNETNGTRLSVSNPKNNRRIAVSDFEWVKTAEDFYRFMEDYISTCGDGYFEKVERMRNDPHRTIKYRIGDIFRFDIDRTNYGYGLIIGKTRDIEKWPELPQRHPLRFLMTQPILIRLYKLKTLEATLSVDELERYELLPAEIASDGDIFWGTHDIIGNRHLTEEDIDFPMHFGRSVDFDKKRIYCLAWGFAMLQKDPEEIQQGLEADILSNNLLNIGVSINIKDFTLQKALKGESSYYKHSDIRHPENAVIKEAIFRQFEVSNDIDIDLFNEKYNGLTRRMYLEHLYK